MKNNHWIWISILISFSVLGPVAPAQKVAYYVSPTGKDSNPGTVIQPLATVAGVESKLAANYLNNCKAQTGPIIVQFRRGTWYNQSNNLTHSGCSSVAPVIFENFPGEVPVFSAGTQVTNWINVGGSLWQATLPSNTVNFEALYYNGQRRLRARLGSSAASALGQYYHIAGPVAGHYDRFYYNATDPISTSWSNYAPATGNPCGQTPGPIALQGEIQVLDFELWDVSRQRISCIDTTSHIIYLTGSTTSGYAHGYIAGHRYLIENLRDALTVAGQWYVDRSVPGAWVLHYFANPGDHPKSDTVVIPQQAQVFTGNNLQYRSFIGLTFSHDNYVIDSKGYAGSEVEALLPSAVQCMDCSHVTFDTDTFAHISGYALGLPTDDKGTSTSNIVQNSAFYDVGGGGIMLGKIATGPETDSNVPQLGTVQNNIFQGYGRVFPGAGAIALLIGHDMTFAHNDVTDAYSQGIMVCFPNTTRSCAGMYNSNGAFNISTTYNHVWNLGQGILNDFGGVYYATYGATGEVISGNKVHDLSDATAIGDVDGYGANGIYLDRGGAITASSNLVYRTENGVSMTTGPSTAGQSITLSNNILAFNREDVLSMYSCPQPGYSQFSFGTNIVYQDRTGKSSPTANLQGGDSYLGTPVGFAQEFTDNDYWNTSETFSSTKAFSAQNSACQDKVFYNLAAWQGLGEDSGSLAQDPGFTDPNYPVDDYSFLAGPPTTGFVPFNTSGTCATCPGRTQPVLVPPVVPETFPTAPYAASAF
jgi:hypothetical protein